MKNKTTKALNVNSGLATRKNSSLSLSSCLTALAGKPANAAKNLVNKSSKNTSYLLHTFETGSCRRAYLASVLSGFIVMLAMIMPVLIGQDVQAVDYSASITTSGNKSINVSPRANGTGTTISADDITVTTTCRAGYNLTVATSVNDNNLYLGGDSSKNSAGTYFSPVDGSTALNSTTNAWGYYYNASTTPTESSVFSAVPASSSTVATIITPTASATDINDNFSVYYGVSVANGMNTGTYKMIPDTSVTPNKDGAIVYYLTMADECTSYKVQYNPTGADNNGVLRTGTGTMTDQLIKENIATNLTANTFTAPNIDNVQYYFAGWNTAQDGSGTNYINEQSVTNLENASIGDTITLYAQWTDCPGGYICYDNNAAPDTNLAGTMGNEAASSTTTKLLASNFSRSSYGFAGWNTRADGSGTSYGPNETLTYPSNTYSSGGLRLYAMWVEPAKDSSNNELAFQTENLLTTTLSDGETLNDKTIGYVTALKDARDNQVYAIAKLADGKYWMIENLRLDNTPELTTANTNGPSLPLNSSWYYKNQQGTLTTSNHLSVTSDPTQTTPTDTAWCMADSSDCSDQSMIATNNTTNRSIYTPGDTMTRDTNIYSYGNYYNWYSATAGNGTYSHVGNINTSGDICPKGWHLPYGWNGTGATEGREGGNTPGGFYYLNYKINNNTDASSNIANRNLRAYPNNFVSSGYVFGNSIYYQGSDGVYWSSTSTTGQHDAYVLEFYAALSADPGTLSYTKPHGMTVRCVAK